MGTAEIMRLKVDAVATSPSRSTRSMVPVGKKGKRTVRRPAAVARDGIEQGELVQKDLFTTHVEQQKHVRGEQLVNLFDEDVGHPRLELAPINLHLRHKNGLKRPLMT